MSFNSLYPSIPFVSIILFRHGDQQTNVRLSVRNFETILSVSELVMNTHII